MTGIKCIRNSLTLKNIGRFLATCLIIFTAAVFLNQGAVIYRLSHGVVICDTLGPHNVTSVTSDASTLSNKNPCSATDSKIDEKTFQVFNKTITSEEKDVFKDLLEDFAKIANENMLDFFMCGGSLLGSYRHLGMIPWDDDFDFMMNSSQKKAIKEAFHLSSNLTLDTSTIRWKVYSNLSSPIRYRKWMWPFLDISFFNQNNTHLWDVDRYFPKACFPHSWVFPTVLRPFWDLWLPAPRHTERALKREFDIDMCASSTYNHKREKYIRGNHKTVPCKSMCDRVPMVSRHAPNDSVIIETLYNGNRRLSSVALNKT